MLASAAKAQDLLPPSDSTKESRSRDLWRCLGFAEGKFGQDGYSRLAVFDDLKPHLLKDRKTAGYVYTTMLSRRSAPVASEDGYPRRREGAFTSTDAVTERYVMCLRARGYTWSDSRTSYFEEVKALAERDVLPALTELAMLHACAGCKPGTPDYNEFARLLRQAAERGYAVAQFNLGLAYSRGDGVPIDDEQALNWMLASAKNGYDRAKPIIDRESQMRAEVAAKRSDARELDEIRQKAEQGDAGSQYAFATRLEDGRGVERDMSKAMEWYRKAAEAGNSKAQSYLGVIYERGRGVPHDYAEAVRWYGLAAERGEPQAQYNLAILYYYGYGVDQNKEQARKWMERAQEGGFRAAAGALKELY